MQYICLEESKCHTRIAGSIDYDKLYRSHICLDISRYHIGLFVQCYSILLKQIIEILKMHISDYLLRFFTHFTINDCLTCLITDISKQDLKLNEL